MGDDHLAERECLESLESDMDELQAGALLFSGALLFLVFAWWNQKSGVAVFNVALQANRHSDPRRFWIIQGLWISFSAILAVCGLLVFLGLLPPA